MSEPNPRRPGPPHHPEVREVVRRQREVSQNPTREEQRAGFRGWNERGYVPHRDEPGLTQFVTFRLADSFPAELRDEWEKLLKIEDDRERRTQLEAWLDLGHGVCHLKDVRIAQLVAEALRKFDSERYRLIAFTIMPNHVHVLFEVGETPMAKVVRDWKGTTARAANALLGLTGSFWQQDYWDTYMRDVEHEEQTIRYIRNNPVKAGLVNDWQQWPWTYVRPKD
ncbi:MAG: transposase [Verrucomicrobiaceae bacterium]